MSDVNIPDLGGAAAVDHFGYSDKRPIACRAQEVGLHLESGKPDSAFRKAADTSVTRSGISQRCQGSAMEVSIWSEVFLLNVKPQGSALLRDLDKLDSEESGEKSCSCFAENGCQERPIGRERRKFGHEWER